MIRSLRRVVVSVPILCAVIFCITSLRWPLVGDASLMHYVVFLMDRGFAPYRQIIDINLPGTYIAGWLVMHLFGDGALAWRLYDLTLGLAAAGAMVLIAWPYHRLAGIFAGSLFILIHGRDGMNQLGQRDLLMAVILLWSVAFTLYALRRRQILFISLAAALAGFAFIIKPTALLFWIATLVFVALLRPDNPWKPAPLLRNGIWPLLLAPAIALSFIVHTHALGSFWFIATRLIPLHNTLLRFPNSYFLLHILPSTLLPLTLLCLVVLAVRKRESIAVLNETEVLLALNVLCGLFSFYVQRKALPYHRYPADAFLLLLLCLIFFRSLEDTHASTTLRIASAAGILFAAFILAPQSLLRTFRLHANPSGFSNLLQKDLTQLGGPSFDGASLNNNVQCIDFTAGCITTLYRMKLTQSTGFLYDCYALQPDSNPVVQQYRRAFWSALIARPPRVLILTDQDCGHPRSFDKLLRWPQLNTLVESRYTLYKQVTPPGQVRWTDIAEPPYSYRIYLLHN
ncbi:hypothetical protein [Edaphobacter sp.]|uniref:hypothetical protein n=1 Tax=Edaphobacter sp. TaxID=1934404 RepID=UPI002DB9B141|nr:hypothetical protein [Edaphobacter sp.]HEU5342241.1 hypothetical protein [Edaphobacter sp.]